MSSIISNEKYSLYYQRIGLIYQKPEIKASLEVILSVFTVLILIFAAIRPTLTNVTSLQKKITDEEVLNKKADNKIMQLFDVQNQLQNYKDSLSLYDTAVPDTYSYYGVLGRIELLAQKNGVTVGSLVLPGTRLYGLGKPKGNWTDKLMKKDASNISRAAVMFSFTGSPKNIVKMITEIENMDRLTLIKNIIFTKESGKTVGSETLKASGEIYFYFYEQGS